MDRLVARWLNSLLVIAAIGAAYGFGWWRGASQNCDDRSGAADRSEATHSVSLMPAAPKRGEQGTKLLLPEERWQRVVVAERTPRSEREMAGALEEMAAHDPARAMELAEAEPSLRLRELLRNAVLRGWSTMAPDAALAYAMKLPGTDNRPSVEAVLSGAARRPAEAIRIATQLSAANPTMAAEYGSTLIAALSEAGAFAEAAQFAAQDASANRAGWANEAFAQWARHQPEQALAALERLTDPTVRTEAFQGLVAGWAEANPRALAEYAMRLPAGDDRSVALGQALPQWTMRDPVSASQWLEHYDPDPGFDSGVMAIATMPALVERRPEVSVEWAQGIADPAMRAGTLKNIAEQWAKRDPVGFHRFLDANARLRADDRSALREGADQVNGVIPSDG